MLKKPKTVKQLKKIADDAFSKAIRLRDTDTFGMVECISCGTRKPWKQMHNGHFVSRSSSTLRFDEENCNGQCPGCNLFKQGNQFAYGLALDLKYGDGTAKKLHDQRFDTHKFTTDELLEIIADSKTQIDFYEKHGV